MAIYRNVQLSFWTDNKVEDDFTPEDKYFYIYLLTNPQTNICGCYEVSYSQMTRQTGYNKDTIIRLLERFDKVHKVIKFDSETKEVLILHWYKYNWSKSEKVLAGVLGVAKHIKSDEFRKYVNDRRRRYNQSEEHKISQKKYFQTKKGKAAQKRYKQSEKGKAAQKRIEAKRIETGKNAIYCKRYREKKKREAMLNEQVGTTKISRTNDESSIKQAEE